MTSDRDLYIELFPNSLFITGFPLNYIGTLLTAYLTAKLAT